MAEQRVTHTPGKLCRLCERPLQDGDADDQACGKCSGESVDRILAPFLVLDEKRTSKGETEFLRSKQALYQAGHSPENDPQWIALRAAAKTRWPDLNAVDSAVVIAVRISKWLEEQRPSVPELRRPLVPVAIVIKLLNDVSLTGKAEPPKRDSNVTAQGLIHDLHDEPPAKFRKGLTIDEQPFGAVIGTKVALGFALNYEDGMTDQGYRKCFKSCIENGEVWVRKARKSGEFTMYLQTTAEVSRCKERQRNSTKLRETARNSAKLK
jgi:hypothetical protein